MRLKEIIKTRNVEERDRERERTQSKRGGREVEGQGGKTENESRESNASRIMQLEE